MVETFVHGSGLAVIHTRIFLLWSFILFQISHVFDSFLSYSLLSFLPPINMLASGDPAVDDVAGWTTYVMEIAWLDVIIRSVFILVILE